MSWFEKQNEGEGRILDVFMNSIKSLIGRKIDKASFLGVTQNVGKKQSGLIYNGLVEKGVISDFCINKRLFVGSQVIIQSKAKIAELLQNEFRILEKSQIEIENK